MAGFTPIRSTSTEEDMLVTISSNAVTLGDMLELDLGATAWTDADASTQHWQLKLVASETVTTAATEIKGRLVASGQMWEAESVNASSASDNGDRMLLTDTNTVNNTGTDNTSQEAVFLQLGVLGAASDNRIWGMIIPGTGIDPDAA